MTRRTLDAGPGRTAVPTNCADKELGTSKEVRRQAGKGRDDPVLSSAFALRLARPGRALDPSGGPATRDPWKTRPSDSACKIRILAAPSGTEEPPLPRSTCAAPTLLAPLATTTGDRLQRHGSLSLRPQISTLAATERSERSLFRDLDITQRNVDDSSCASRETVNFSASSRALTVPG